MYLAEVQGVARGKHGDHVGLCGLVVKDGDLGRSGGAKLLSLRGVSEEGRERRPQIISSSAVVTFTVYGASQLRVNKVVR